VAFHLSAQPTGSAAAQTITDHAGTTSMNIFEGPASTRFIAKPSSSRFGPPRRLVKSTGECVYRVKPV